MDNQNNQSQLDQNVLNIVKALAYTETGGNIKTPPAGKSGELPSTFQFTPGTWRGYSREITGQELPMTRENEAAVVYGKVQKWLKDGYKPEEIASIWNSGKPDAYLHNDVGINKQGVKYDVPGYVKKFNTYLSKFQNTAPGTTPQQQKQPAPQTTQKPPLVQLPTNQQTPPQASSGLLPTLLQAQTPPMKSVTPQ